jgi:hypothetical protein
MGPKITTPRASAAAATLLLAASVASLAAPRSAREPDRQVLADSPTESAISRPEPEAVSAHTSLSRRPAPTPKTQNSSSVASSAATTGSDSSPSCRNSSEERCGPFRWDPEPGPNRPMTIEVTMEPKRPRAGETVTFTISAEDDWIIPDPQEIRFAGDGSCSMTAEDGYDDPGDHEPCILTSMDVVCPTRRGPWDLPAPRDDRRNWTVKHTYREFRRTTWTYCEPHPYGSSATKTLSVEVADRSPV